MNKIEFKINNNGILKLTQEKLDGNVIVHSDNSEDDVIISPADFVMIINLYRDVKEHDLQNDYINPYGVN